MKGSQEIHDYRLIDDAIIAALETKPRWQNELIRELAAYTGYTRADIRKGICRLRLAGAIHAAVVGEADPSGQWPLVRLTLNEGCMPL